MSRLGIKAFLSSAPPLVISGSQKEEEGWSDPLPGMIAWQEKRAGVPQKVDKG